MSTHADTQNARKIMTCGRIHEFAEVRQALGDKGKEGFQQQARVKVLSFCNDKAVHGQDILCRVFHRFDWLHVLH